MRPRTLLATTVLALGAASAAPAQAVGDVVSDAVNVFARGCLDNQPGFDGTPADMTRLGGKQDGESWQFAGGIFASIVRKSDGHGCLVSVPGSPGPVVTSISAELNSNFGGYELVSGPNGQPAAIVDTSSGKFAVIIAPDPRQNLTTLIAQPAPKP